MKTNITPEILETSSLNLPALPPDWEWAVTDERTSNKNLFNPPLTVYLSNDSIRMQFICASYRTEKSLSKVADRLLRELNQALGN